MVNNLDFPAVNGRPVTQAHANLCETRGHATHTVNGVDSDLCPRCGADKSTIILAESPRITVLELVAIEYYDNGIPSALPNGNPFKAYAENHRWGYHGANNNRNCPVCTRNRTQ